MKHGTDCAVSGGSSYRSAYCARAKGEPPTAFPVEARAILARCSPVELAARDAVHAATLAAMTPAERCARADSADARVAQQIATFRAERRMINAELRAMG